MLKKIHIENFKSLKNVDVPCAGLNLLTGVNGAGKSSFIQVLRLLHRAADNIDKLNQTIGIEDYSGETGRDDIQYCYKGASPIIVSVNYTDGGEHEYKISRILGNSENITEMPSMEFRHPNYYSIWERTYGRAENLNIDYLERLDGECPRNVNVTADDVKVAFEKADKDFHEAIQEIQNAEQTQTAAFKRMWNGMRFVDAFRRKPTDVSSSDSYNEMAFLFDSSNDIKAFNPEGEDVMEFLYKHDRYNKDFKLIEKVNQCLNWVSPGARLNIEKKQIGAKSFYIAAVDYGVDGDTRMFKPQNVGFGVSYILPVLTVLLTAGKRTIVIIENPEAHLHPRGQAEIGKLIAETVSRGVQVFIETHSDHVINGIRVAVKKGVLKPSDVNIAFFERKEHDVVDDEGKESREIFTTVRDIKIDENGSLSEYPEDFMDEWNNQLMRLM